MARATRNALHTEITTMWKEARRLGLDFRMAVAGMGRHKDGGSSVRGGLCGGETNGGMFAEGVGGFFSPFESDELPPRFQPCMLKPSDNKSPGAGNHGLVNMRETLISMLPRSSADVTRLRAGATPVVILVSEDPPRLIRDALAGLGVLPPFSQVQAAAIEDQVAPFAALLRGQDTAVTAALFPGASGLDSLKGALVYALTATPGSGCRRGARGTGFIELSRAVGGEVELTCDTNEETKFTGGVGHVMVGLVKDISRRLRPLKLQAGAISTTLAVTKGQSDGGASMPRSRRSGFDYHAASGSLLLYQESGNSTKPSSLRVSYLTW